MRLHFSNSIKDADFAILFFIDATAPTGPALEELAYTATYARERSKGNLRFIGVVLSKVDLLPANPDELIISENPELQNSPVATAIRTRKVILQPIREEGKETRQTAVSRIKREVGEVLKEVIMLEETTWCVFDGRGNPRWNLGNEEAAGEIVDILSARIGRPGPGRSLSPSGRLKRWDTVRLEIGRWGSVRTAAPVDPRSED